jgi:hypothetical protein
MTDNAMVEGKRARMLTGQRVVNRIVRGLLRTPLVCRLVGKRLVTIYAVGRTSGRVYAVPVAFTRHEGALLVGTSFGWGRNLRTGEPVDVRFQGRRVAADVAVSSDEAGVVNAYEIIARDNRNFAKFNLIGFGSSGDPDPADLRRAWAAGARAIRLTLPGVGSVTT